MEFQHCNSWRDPRVAPPVVMDLLDDGAGARCLGCNALTSRTCSVCNVCVFCSTECEAMAATRNFADVACKLHATWPREKNHIGAVGARFVMLPSAKTPITLNDPSHERWTALHQAAVHYLHAFLACQPSRVYCKTTFGMSVVLTPEQRYSCGYQRLPFLAGKTSEAASVMISNMSKLALAQLGQERVTPPRLRDSEAPKQVRQVVMLSGFVAKAKENQSYESARPLVHFDSIYLTHTNNTWTIRRVQPLWEQDLAQIDDAHYHMHYKPKGRVPSNARHPLELVEKALSPLPPTEAPLPPAPVAPNLAPTLAPNPSPTPGSSNPPVVLLPPPVMHTAERDQQSPRSTPPATPPPPAPEPSPAGPWQPYREQALADAQAATEAPPWLSQLQQALQSA